jgi:hypothetical protein
MRKAMMASKGAIMTDNASFPSTAHRPAPLDAAQVLHLRLEGLALAVFGLWLFADTGASWWLFATLILAPDLSALGYLAGPRRGAVFYNLAHVFTLPALTIGVGWVSGTSPVVAVGAIWWCHVAIDRAVGYGLKAKDGFDRTHLSL